MITYTIRKNEHGEFVVRFRLNGILQETWTYFGSDMKDAKATAEHVKANYKSEPYMIQK